MPILTTRPPGTVIHPVKLQCNNICYFYDILCIMLQVPMGVLTFKRQLVQDGPKWEGSEATLTRLHITSTGTIEDECAGMLQVRHCHHHSHYRGRGCFDVAGMYYVKGIVTSTGTIEDEGAGMLQVRHCHHHSHYRGRGCFDVAGMYYVKGIVTSTGTIEDEGAGMLQVSYCHHHSHYRGQRCIVTSTGTIEDEGAGMM